MKALITGITGQDGSYLAELLLSKGYDVHGVVRSSNYGHISHLLPKITVHNGDLTDDICISGLVQKVQPSEIYHLASISDIQTSFQYPVKTGIVNGLSTISFLEAIRQHCFECKYYQSSSAEMFGNTSTCPQSESTPFHPNSHYATAKLYAHWTAVNYREMYGIHASNGILYNHSSPRSGERFVTKKIVKSLVRIKRNKLDILQLGNLDNKRDWGYAPDYMEAAWKIVQQNIADDYIIATGKSYSVRQFCTYTAKALDIHLGWHGGGSNEYAVDEKGHKIIVVDKQQYRVTDIMELRGNNTKAKTVLGWQPTMGLEQMIDIMIRHEIGNI